MSISFRAIQSNYLNIIIFTLKEQNQIHSITCTLKSPLVSRLSVHFGNGLYKLVSRDFQPTKCSTSTSFKTNNFHKKQSFRILTRKNGIFRYRTKSLFIAYEHLPEDDAEIVVSIQILSNHSIGDWIDNRVFVASIFIHQG